MIDPDQLVGVAEVADAAGVTRGAVSLWSSRDISFPTPVAHLAAGPLWCWPEVAAWLEATGRGDEPKPAGPYDRYALELTQVDGFITNGLKPYEAAKVVAEHSAHDHGLPVHTFAARLRHLWPDWKARERSVDTVQS